MFGAFGAINRRDQGKVLDNSRNNGGSADGNKSWYAVCLSNKTRGDPDAVAHLFCNTREENDHAEVLIRRYPDRYIGYALKGLVAFKESRFEDALALDRQALRLAMPVESAMVRRNIYAAQVKLKRFGEAYKTLLSVSNPMEWSTSAKDLYDLSLAAVASGHTREGRALLELARLKVPASETQLSGQIEEFGRLLPPGT